jgi:6-hydroxycyclohex-1-ene-1-carbonyl-CoA dehydrogenase
MKALRLLAPREPLEIREIAVPEPGAEDALIRVAGCGVCHTDIGFWRDGVATRRALPLTLGHEISGVVVAAGPAHRALIGREVIVPAVLPCGSCELCRSGRGNACRQQRMPGNDIDGGFAEYVATPARGLCVVDDRGGYTLSELSVIADAIATPYQAVTRSGLQPGDLAVVVGVGGIGAYAVQIAHALGARVVAIDVDESRLSLIAEHGADLTIHAARTDFRTLRAQVLEQARAWGCGQHGWKLFECSGNPDGQQTAWGLLVPAATLLVVGFTLAKIELRLSNVMALDATVQGVWGCVPELYPAALELVTRGRVALRPFIERHPLSRGVEVLERVANHQLARRAILEPDGDAGLGPGPAGAEAPGRRS